MRKKELIPYVTSSLADDSSRVRRVATYALSDIKDPSAVPYLMKALDDADQEVVKGAISALKRITGESFTSEQKEQEAAQKEIAAYYKEWWVKQNK
jgi:HEAT repeat protein